ncbi:MAG: Cys-tRNA(Pro) deacylase [Candidatus Latescibacterota bacterium]
MKTNALRIIEKLGIPYEIREYQVDENDLSATHVAGDIGLPSEQVFKTLVVRGDKTGVLLACIPSDRELDLKELARASGNKKADLVPLKEVLVLTGYVRGGVSPVGTKKRFPVFLDKSALNWPFISMSAGARGCQMLLNPADLGKVVDVKIQEISKESTS